MKGYRCLGLVALIAAGQWAPAMASEQKDPRLVAHEQAVAAYVQRTGKAPPVVREYAYGMNLDMRRVVERTAVTRSCDAVPMWVTYEDSGGQLVTLRYSEQGACPKFQG